MKLQVVLFPCIVSSFFVGPCAPSLPCSNGRSVDLSVHWTSTLIFGRALVGFGELLLVPFSSFLLVWLEQELLAEREALQQEERDSNEIMQKLEYEAELVKRKLATSEQRAEMASATAEKANALLRKENQRLEASHASMLQRCRFCLSHLVVFSCSLDWWSKRRNQLHKVIH